jgi:4-aminobutyrate aminotransferase-like enzyme
LIGVSPKCARKAILPIACRLIRDQRATLARRLAQLAPGDLAFTVFGVSGGEAIDLAIKIAREYTRKPNVISAHG